MATSYKLIFILYLQIKTFHKKVIVLQSYSKMNKLTFFFMERLSWRLLGLLWGRLLRCLLCFQIFFHCTWKNPNSKHWFIWIIGYIAANVQAYNKHRVYLRVPLLHSWCLGFILKLLPSIYCRSSANVQPFARHLQYCKCIVEYNS